MKALLKNLPLGARFRYLGHERTLVLCAHGFPGLVADDKGSTPCGWQQGIYAAFDETHDPETLLIEVDDVEPAEQIAQLKAALAHTNGLLHELADMAGDLVPARECRCFLSPPCNDCTEYAGIREILETVESHLKAQEVKP